MSVLTIEGRARLLGDDINTDYIISSRRKRDTLDGDVLKNYLLEDLDPGFAATVKPGDLIVAGENFGCGSAMEVAVTVVLAAGIRAVCARSFSRTYYRNAINNGLLPVECDTSSIAEGDRLQISVEEAINVNNVTTGRTIAGQRIPGIMVGIFEAGGLVPYFARHGGFRS
ncbi:MAG TPA: 3-isopropylmalate dehydratase [Trueperaceae bacterium]